MICIQEIKIRNKKIKKIKLGILWLDILYYNLLLDKDYMMKCWILFL